MKTGTEKIIAWSREPVYQNWKRNEIIRPVILGFYCILLSIAGVYVLVSYLT